MIEYNDDGCGSDGNGRGCIVHHLKVPCTFHFVFYSLAAVT